MYILSSNLYINIKSTNILKINKLYKNKEIESGQKPEIIWCTHLACAVQGIISQKNEVTRRKWTVIPIN